MNDENDNGEIPFIQLGFSSLGSSDKAGHRRRSGLRGSGAQGNLREFKQLAGNRGHVPSLNRRN